MVLHAWYPLSLHWMDGETRGRWMCQSEREGWSSCICLSCLDIVTCYSARYYTYILKRLMLKEDKALHSCCHKYLSSCSKLFPYSGEVLPHSLALCSSALSFLLFLLYFFFLSSEIFFGFFFLISPFSLIFNFSHLIYPISSFTFPLSFWWSPFILLCWCPGCSKAEGQTALRLSKFSSR